METALYYSVGVLLAIITLAIGIPALVKMSRASKTSATGGSQKTGFSNPFKGASMGTWWVSPLILWIVFLAILGFLFPSAWMVLWRNQPLFWIAQVIYGVLAFSGKDKKDWRERPVQPLYKKLIFCSIICLFTVAVWNEAHRFGPDAPVRTTHSKIIVTAPSVTFHQTEVTQATPVPLLPQPLKKTFVVRADEVSIATIPAGYNVSRIDGVEKTIYTKTEVNGGALDLEFSTKTTDPVEITVWYTRVQN